MALLQSPQQHQCQQQQQQQHLHQHHNRRQSNTQTQPRLGFLLACTYLIVPKTIPMGNFLNKYALLFHFWENSMSLRFLMRFLALKKP